MQIQNKGFISFKHSYKIQGSNILRHLLQTAAVLGIPGLYDSLRIQIGSFFLTVV